MIARVSAICEYHRRKNEDDEAPNDEYETEAMRRGTAFHKFLQHVQLGTYETGSVDGYTFTFVGDYDLYLPPLREIRREKDYGGITASGCADAPVGNTIYDHKTTERPFDAEGYLSGYQHRYYMDIFGADRFVWNVWEMRWVGHRVMTEDALTGQDFVSSVTHAYEVRALHRLETYRYPGMEADCTDLAQEYREYAARHYLPDFNPDSLSRVNVLKQQLRASLEVA